MSKVVLKSPISHDDITLNLFDNDNCVCEFIRNGIYWEKDLCALMSEMLTPILNSDDTILDIGAYIGTHTVALSKKFKDNIVFSFEANGSFYSKHVENLKDNQCENVVHKNAIVTSDSFLNKLRMSDIDINKEGQNFGGTGCIFTNGEHPTPDQSITIDMLNIQNVKLIKLDVEGHELNVLEGSIATIKKYTPLIFIEIWESNV
jgi:FkbM family methyltransferase